MTAAELFAAGHDNAAVAKELQVSVRSVQRWRRSWQERGPDGLRSRGPVSRPKLNDACSPCWRRSRPGARSPTAGQIRPGPLPASRR
ncbi:helix-turn-helix domain-containing protein [Streptomyces sp. NPDC005727]|uniref:helix-turn-helix domain-containing protein n=1 Tax=unclassified Streptomyces TaxID=2593676 RepID=UPI0033C9E07E